MSAIAPGHVCPHCHAVAAVERSRRLRWRCAVCGGPVVPTEQGVARSQGELASLVRAQRAHAMAFGWRAGAIMLGLVAVLGIGFAMLLLFASHLAAGVIGGIALGAGMLAILLAGRARARDADASDALEDAWQKVAAEVLAARAGQTTAAQLARAMQTDEDHAQALLGKLSASGRVRVDVRDDAELAYRAEPSERAADADAADAEDAAAAAKPELRAR